MEPVKQQKILSKFKINSQSLQFLGSVFFLSVILLCSSLLPSTFNFMQFFSCNMGKNYMFLLCNGILVLIVKNSGLMVSNSHHCQDLHLLKKQKEVDLAEMKAEDKVVKVVEEIQEIEDKSLVVITQHVDNDYHRAVIIQENEEEEEDQEKEEEEEELVELLSTEELNKKCDEFIRDMRKQLILVQSY